MLDFTNQVVLVTGAGSAKGMGRVIAQTFGKQGAKVVICDINQAGCDANVEEMKKMGIDATGYAANLTDPEAVKELVNTIVDKYGRIDVLVNNAGISQKVTVADMTLDDIKRIFNVNMFGLFLITQAVCEVMKKQNYGRIVHLSSVSGKRGGGIFGGAHYSASKAAVLGFSKNLAREVSSYGITTNCVCPGLINTEIWKSLPKEQMLLSMESQWDVLESHRKLLTQSYFSLLRKLPILLVKRSTLTVDLTWIKSDTESSTQVYYVQNNPPNASSQCIEEPAI